MTGKFPLLNKARTVIFNLTVAIKCLLAATVTGQETSTIIQPQSTPAVNGCIRPDEHK